MAAKVTFLVTSCGVDTKKKEHTMIVREPRAYPTSWFLHHWADPHDAGRRDIPGLCEEDEIILLAEVGSDDGTSHVQEKLLCHGVTRNLYLG